MKNILVIESSPRGTDSMSRRLTEAIIRKLKEKTPDAEVTTRDLSVKTAPHLDGALLGAFFTPPEKQNETQRQATQYSEEAIAELRIPMRL